MHTMLWGLPIVQFITVLLVMVLKEGGICHHILELPDLLAKPLIELAETLSNGVWHHEAEIKFEFPCNVPP